MKTNKEIKKLGLLGSFAIYIPAALLMYFSTKHLIPLLSATTGMEVILCWFIVAGLIIFTPLIITGLFILKYEGYHFSKNTWIERLRFRKLRKQDIIWSIVGLIIVGILSGLIIKGLKIIIGEFNHSPDFMSFEPLTRDRFWLLLVWIPYWLLNILGEEFFWRGVMLPRQEVAFGKYTWIIHGFGWGLFHIAFGWQLLITLIPLIFIQSYIVQKTKNSWVGVIMHAGLNGPSFIAISFGLI
ncbi:MAG TPA: CPBP family intramembrane metalloprotease [Candidatus Kapabacteria bacterium]|jgi:membrane protease YdiL (CAAX protease family)|nr:CPBP family intramembrane metalloprotease [Candidatus Kapabacteria bacterium]HOQ48328.1 CPBP family intramembrane metalloprotease [Candidatus Kapabacteria bacterium]HPU22889.1 CPBP family intramembrane metalloprotease [Candidatus Kapabacteria bacterium]